MTASVIVLDGEQRVALAVTRNLGQRGLRVIVCSHIPRPLAGASRWCALTETVPNVTHDCDALLYAVESIVRRENVAVVFALTDASLTALIDSQSIAGARLAAPSPSTYTNASNKARLVDRAPKVDVRVPRTVLINREEEFRAALRQWDGPVVIKPAVSRYRLDGKLRSTSVIICKNAAEATSQLPHLEWLGHIPGLLQEFIPGYGAGVFTLYGESGAICWFSHRRIREKPPSGGVSVLSESAPLEDDLQRQAEVLLNDIDWVGPAMVEFRIDEEGKPWLMEINGRFWGSLQLSIDCGIEFPWLWYQETTGCQPQPVADYVKGRRLRWLLGDLDHLYLLCRDPNLRVRQKLRAIFSFLNFFDSRTRLEVLRPSDPSPFRRELSAWMRSLLSPK